MALPEDTLTVPARLIEGADPTDVEWYVSDFSHYTGDMSLTQLARILEMVQDELRWRQEQMEK